MSPGRLFRVKNAMLFSNAISNLIGSSIANLMSRISISFSNQPIPDVVNRADILFDPAAFLLIFVITLGYEAPIRRYLNQTARKERVSEELRATARRRLLNEPFFLIAIDLGIWMVAALLYPALFWISGAEPVVMLRPFTIALFTGLITVTVAFFVFEFVLQKRVFPHVFPEGGLYETPGTFRIRIRTRLIAFLFACNLLPFAATLETLAGTFFSQASPEQSLALLRKTILVESLLFMAVGIWLTLLVSGTWSSSLKEIIRVLRRVHKGRYNDKVQVTTNDEIGYTGDIINEMTMGLRERDVIKETFGRYVAPEVRDEILSGRIPLDGEQKEVTVMFADLRNFTPMTESLDPKAVVRIMNTYFDAMTRAIEKEHGLVLQFVGDEIYAVFGAPVARPDHPQRAFRAALEMSKELAVLNRHLNEKDQPQLKHGIGINTGHAVAASMGSRERQSYLLVGDTINLAARLQEMTKTLKTEILVSRATYSRLNTDIPFTRLSDIRIRGKSRTVTLYACSTSMD